MTSKLIIIRRWTAVQGITVQLILKTVLTVPSGLSVSTKRENKEQQQFVANKA
jgi:hypothetical protein